ncbi:hypothetical protein V1478_006964, partial [Vespula squamosa]
MDGRKWPSVVPISSMAHQPDVFLRVASFNFNRPLIRLFAGIFVLEIIGQNNDDDKTTKTTRTRTKTRTMTVTMMIMMMTTTTTTMTHGLVFPPLQLPAVNAATS